MNKNETKPASTSNKTHNTLEIHRVTVRLPTDHYNTPSAMVWHSVEEFWCFVFQDGVEKNWWCARCTLAKTRPLFCKKLTKACASFQGVFTLNMSQNIHIVESILYFGLVVWFHFIETFFCCSFTEICQKSVKENHSNAFLTQDIIFLKKSMLDYILKTFIFNFLMCNWNCLNKVPITSSDEAIIIKYFPVLNYTVP